MTGAGTSAGASTTPGTLGHGGRHGHGHGVRHGAGDPATILPTPATVRIPDGAARTGDIGLTQVPVLPGQCHRHQAPALTAPATTVPVERAQAPTVPEIWVADAQAPALAATHRARHLTTRAIIQDIKAPVLKTIREDARHTHRHTITIVRATHRHHPITALHRRAGDQAVRPVSAEAVIPEAVAQEADIRAEEVHSAADADLITPALTLS